MSEQHTHPWCPGCVRDLVIIEKARAYFDSGPHYDMTPAQMAMRDELKKALGPWTRSVDGGRR